MKKPGLAILFILLTVFLLSACGDDDSIEKLAAEAAVNSPNATFDSGSTNGWTLTGLWHVSNRRSISPPNSVWFGQEATGDFATGFTEVGDVQRTVNLNGIASVNFDYFLDSECGPGVLSSNCVADALFLDVSTDGGATWTRLFDTPDTGGAWANTTVDLSAYTGTTVDLRFNFDTFDAILNNFEGAFLDNIVFSP